MDRRKDGNREDAMKIKTAIRRFGTQLEADGKSAHTSEAYLRDVSALASSIGGNVDIARITPAAIARYFASDAMKKRETVSVNRMKTSVRIFFRYLAESGCLKKDPSRLIKASKCERKIPSALYQRETQRLLKTIRASADINAKRDYVIISLLLGTGMRLGSMAGISIGHIDFGKGIIKTNGKGNAEDVAYLQLGLKRLLKTYIHSKGLTETSPLFCNSRGDRLGIRSIQQRVSCWLKEAGINSGASVHTLRHTFATRLYEKTRDLYLVQKALCHRQITTTEIYTRVSDSSLRKAVNLL